MSAQQDWRIEFLGSIRHISSAFDKCRSGSGPHGFLRAPDLHKITEGLFLSAWTHWEEFVRHLLILDVATINGSLLRREISSFRTKGAPLRLAEGMLNHPDPEKFVEWSDFRAVIKRADKFLPGGHRFSSIAGAQNDFEMMKRMRNAVAHKSDRAWASFISLAKAPPFGLTAKQTRGITPGRFLSSHQWGGTVVMRKTLSIFIRNARTLVP